METHLLGMSPEELSAVARQAGLPAFAGKQLAHWLYVRRVGDIGEMTNLSKRGREALSARHAVGLSAPLGSAVSVDGTVKYLFPVHGLAGKSVESVRIPDGERTTLCISCQCGCRMGCKFCMTGRQGFHGNLSAADMLSQVFSSGDFAGLTNLVLMGMGEPLDNWGEVRRLLLALTAPWGVAWSPRRITLSTVGVVPQMETFLREAACHLAVSLHNPFPSEREALMPVERAWPLRETLSILRKFDFTGQRRVSFEYILFAGWNDTPRHARALARLLSGLECRVNLIRFHPIPDFPLHGTDERRLAQFHDLLAEAGVRCTVRASRGQDIAAACGLLAQTHETCSSSLE